MSRREGVAEGAEVLFYEYGEALQRAIVRINYYLSQSTHLRRAVPAVGAVDHRADAASQGLGDEEACLQHRLDVLEPLALVDALFFFGNRKEKESPKVEEQEAATVVVTASTAALPLAASVRKSTDKI